MRKIQEWQINRSRIRDLEEDVQDTKERRDNEITDLQKRVYALEHTPKFKRGDRVAIMERIPEYIGNRTMRVGKLTKIDTGTILYHTGNDGNQHLYNIDLDRGEIVLNYSESQLEPLSEVEPEKK